ncbi:MAG: QueT transporter family protein [Clostridia bacterium]|nr:QueT transporter family protein [Clostridia bacterium]
MQNRKKRTFFLVEAAVIAALYIVLCFAQELILPSSATGAIQVRIAEVLSVLVCFTPAAIPGLAVGCFVTNLLTVGVIPTDLILGTLATLLASLTGYCLRNVKLFKIPVPTLLMPVIFNAVIIGLEIEIFFIEGVFTFTGFLVQAALVGLGELIACVGLGIPLYLVLNKLNVFNKFNT